MGVIKHKYVPYHPPPSIRFGQVVGNKGDGLSLALLFLLRTGRTLYLSLIVTQRIEGSVMEADLEVLVT